MRQVGSLSNEQDAQRFAAYLITQGIDAQAEQDAQDWAIWVRDENSISQARESFERFKVDPHDDRYRGVERNAEAIRRQEVQRRIEAKKNLVEVRGRWSGPAARRAPLTMTLIVLSVVVTIVGDRGNSTRGIGGTINSRLAFCERKAYLESKNNPLACVARGELWRIVTPIFKHLDWMHLAFNMIMFYQFASLIESRRGTGRLALLILLIAVASNLAQALFPQAWGGWPFFGGMSGVVYGLFGYVWMKALYDPRSGFFMSPITVAILVGWLFLCMTGYMGPVANVAHVVGLIVGMALGYFPALIAR